MGVPVEVPSADEPGADPKGKSKQAEPGRPAIWIELIVGWLLPGRFDASGVRAQSCIRDRGVHLKWLIQKLFR